MGMRQREEDDEGKIGLDDENQRVSLELVSELAVVKRTWVNMQLGERRRT